MKCCSSILIFDLILALSSLPHFVCNLIITLTSEFHPYLHSDFDVTIAILHLDRTQASRPHSVGMLLHAF